MKASDNQFPKLLLTPVDPSTITATAGTLAVLLDSTDGNKMKRKAADGTLTVVEGGSSSGGGSRLSGSVRYSTGNISFGQTGGSWANVPSFPTLTLTGVAVGDVIVASPFLRVDNGNNTVVLDLSTEVAGAPVNSLVSGLAAQTGAAPGPPGTWVCEASINVSVTGSTPPYTVKAADLSSGTLTLRLRYYSFSGSRTLLAGAINPAALSAFRL